MFSAICSYHSISNATRWSLADFGYGLILRTCHILDAKQICRFSEFCSFLMYMVTDTDGVTRLIFKEEFRMFASINLATDNVGAEFIYSSSVGKNLKAV